MSDELEWELYDVFEAGLFAFPLYEHQTARRIIRYLLYRGVLAEEIADAIEVRTSLATSPALPRCAGRRDR